MHNRPAHPRRYSNSKMGTLMKMAAVVLLLPVVLAQGNGDPCVYKAVGDSVTIPLQRKDCEEDTLSWKLNSNDIFRKKKQTVSVGKLSAVTEDGSLKLVDLQVPSSGVYIAELHDTDGKLCGQARQNLCVIERVSRPYVTYTCSEDAVTLTCDSAESKVNWTLNGGTSEGAFKKTLTVPGRPAHDAKYSCTAWNEASQEKSRDTTVRCEVQLSFVISQNEEVREGEDVSILCASTPPADEYTVWTPRNQSRLRVADGKFRLPKVTKDDAGTYLCQPEWTLPGPYDDAAKATLQLRVSSAKDGQALRGGTTPRVTSGSEGTLLLATHLLLVLCLSGPVV
ncbi:uncharacterized protein LOC118236625 [Anguilla anguilla]|uniref:uncharacterized protein LOC118236625 n=1 Tax=Anguilla anguilla TaxID=7936 RepID=UPI0015ACC759|nr:uncharacterized protein LOC118236625 [Anguilla anguilla]